MNFIAGPTTRKAARRILDSSRVAYTEVKVPMGFGSSAFVVTTTSSYSRDSIALVLAAHGIKVN